MGRQTYYYGGERKTLTREQTAQIAYQAGFRGDDLWKAVAIAGRESGYAYNVHGTERPHSEYSGDRGLFQINYVNDRILREAGIIRSREELFDPLTNARAAFLLYQRAGNSFAPAWSVGPNGWDGRGDPLYKTNPQAAREAVQRAAQQGLLGRDVNIGDIIGNIPVVGGVITDPSNIPVVGGAIGAVTDAGSFFVALSQSLLSRDWWIRALQVIGGLVLILLGINVMASGMVTNVAREVVGARASVAA